ncbi:MAG: NUDIX hydrolase [Candidatus Woesearchaeota archaeon]
MNQTIRPKKTISGCAIIKNGELLLLFKTKKSYYEFPGGKLDPEESLEQCAIRETSEEINCKVALKKRWGPYNFSLDVKDVITDVESHVFEADIISGEPIITENVFSGFKWIPIENIEKYPLAPNVKLFIEDYRTQN